MKTKTIFAMLLTLIMLTGVVSAQETKITLPDEPGKYWLQVRVPEWFKQTFTFNSEKLADLRLKLAEKRLMELEKLAAKYEQIADDKQEKYDSWLQKTEDRRQKLIEKIEMKIDRIPEDKRIDYTAKIAEHREKFKNAVSNMAEKPKSKLRITLLEPTYVIEEIPPEESGGFHLLCGGNGATYGKITISGIPKVVVGSGDTQTETIGTEAKTIVVPGCLCDETDQCPGGTLCQTEFEGTQLSKGVCIPDKNNPSGVDSKEKRICEAKGGNHYDGVSTCAPCPEGQVCTQECRIGCSVDITS
jgi:hypothetical protein